MPAYVIEQPAPIWPETIKTGVIDDSLPDALLAADGLTAWGLVMAGNQQPDNFGKALAEISQRLGVLATPDGLMKWSSDHGY